MGALTANITGMLLKPEGHHGAMAAGKSVAQPATSLLILTLATVNWGGLQCWTRGILRPSAAELFKEMTSQHRQYHQMLQRCEDWLNDPFADEDAEDFDFEAGFQRAMDGNHIFPKLH